MLDCLKFPSERVNVNGRADPSSEAVHLAAAAMVVVADPPSVTIQPNQ
jgi:hypothetical protein